MYGLDVSYRRTLKSWPQAKKKFPSSENCPEYTRALKNIVVSALPDGIML